MLKVSRILRDLRNFMGKASLDPISKEAALWPVQGNTAKDVTVWSLCVWRDYGMGFHSGL